MRGRHGAVLASRGGGRKEGSDVRGGQPSPEGLLKPGGWAVGARARELVCRRT